MNITNWAIQNNRVTLVVVAALFFSGLAAYVSLPKAQDPGFTIRTATITTYFPGASPERVELLVTDLIEEKIQEMPEVEEITSESQSGISVINVDFYDYLMDMQTVFDDFRQKVEDVAPSLPSGAQAPIVNDEYGDTFGHIYSLVGPSYSAKEMSDQASRVRNALLKLDQVAKVDLYGDIDERIYIEYDNAKLTELGISPQSLGNTLESLNILSSGGDITVDRERINLEPTGNFNTVSDLQNAIVELPGQTALIRLGDIATVYRDYEDPPSVKVRIDGEEGISIAISLKDGGNLLTLGEQLKTLIPQLEADMPLGMSLSPMFYQSELTGKAVDDFVSNLFQAIVIVVIVMVVSLGLRTGMVVASLIPVVMVSTFFVMAQFDIGIDRISLAALIISLGLLVDNAIVVVEATIVRREDGENPVAAAINAATEMKGPLLISSLTTAAAFTPIALAESTVGEFTVSIFYVVTIALLLSWITSMTFIPMLTPFIHTKEKNNEEQDQYTSPIYQRYRGLLTASVKHPLLFCGFVIALFFTSIYGMNYVPKVFIPPSEDPHMTVDLVLPVGTDIEATEAMIMRMEDYFSENLLVSEAEEDTVGLTGWTAYIGSGGPRFILAFNPSNPNQAEALLIVNVNSSEALDPMKAAIENYFFEFEPDVQLQVKRLANGPPVSYPIEIKVSGEEFQTLFDIVTDVKAGFWELPDVTVVNDSWGPQSKKFIIEVDQARAFRANVTNEDIATSLNASLSGMQLTEFREGDDVIPVVLRTEGAARDDLNKLENLTVFSQSTSAVVPLSQVADIQVVWEPSRIKRLDRDRMITVQVQLRDGVTAAEVSAQAQSWLEPSAQSWPFGYFYTEGGETDESDTASKSIIAALPFACIAIIVLLILQFNSIRRTGIVLVTIPLGLIGIVFGLLVARSVFGFFTFLGLISLAGIVINNAIVLLDRIKVEIELNGLSEADAVLQAAQQRARPILLTTATTIGGMIPLWIGGGPMFEPMAIAILFGLLFATGITLLLVPVMYSLLFRVSYK
ncbi:MAG: efflux RND transporter permease subunit [Pseudomonadota bacterium]